MILRKSRGFNLDNEPEYPAPIKAEIFRATTRKPIGE